MKYSDTLFLKIVITFVGIAVAAGLVYFPQTEGRAVNLDLISIYSDPFIIYVYLGSMPFFFGLYQAIKLLTLIDHNKAFTQQAVNTLKYMKQASLTLIAGILMAMIYIRFFAHGDDPAGPMMLGICMNVAFAAIATAAGIFQKLFQNAVDLKKENDLTV